MLIPVGDVTVGMIINTDDAGPVIITEAWRDQGPGLGIMLKGTTVEKVEPWQDRFLDPFEKIDQIKKEGGF